MIVENEDDARLWFEVYRWGARIGCPRCGSQNKYVLDATATMPYTCAYCRKQYSVRFGTVMQHSKLSYLTWYKIIQSFSNQHHLDKYKTHDDLQSIGIRRQSYLNAIHRTTSVCNDAKIPIYFGQYPTPGDVARAIFREVKLVDAGLVRKT